MHPPDLRHHLLLRIKINELAEHPIVGVLQGHADDRILRSRYNMLVTVLGSPDPASDKTKYGGAFRIPAAVITGR